MNDTIFDKIIAGAIPCHKIYEDYGVLAFLDIDPVQPGHVLIVPKTKATYVWDLDQKTYTGLMLAAQKVAQHIKSSLNVPYVGEKIVGTDVPYAHIHLIPFSEPQQLDQKPAQIEPDHEALAAMAKKLAF